MVANGWMLFEEAVASVGAGHLPQLLRSVHTMMTLTPPPPPTPTAPAQQTGQTPMDVMPGMSQSAASLVKSDDGDEPVVVLVGEVRNWA